jgi:hypothetical protein
MDGFFVSLPVFFIRCCCWLYTLLFLFFPSLSVTQHLPTFSGWRFMHADGWVGMVCGMGMVGGCLLLGLGVRWIFCQASFQMGRSSEGRESPLSVVVQIQA